MDFKKDYVIVILLVGLAARSVDCGNFTHPLNETDSISARRGRWFPFYTLGRFENSECMGSSNLIGTCDLAGSCDDNGGIATGSCSTVTPQAVCCVYQMACGMTTSFNNTYFYNPGYPSSYLGGSRCTIGVRRSDTDICQLRIDFLDFSLAPPNGDGSCNTDYMAISGGSSRVPRLCGQNTGQHVYVNFNGNAAITIALESTASFAFNRHWHFKLTQIPCDSEYRAPAGCLQYYVDGDTDDSGPIRSFNYGSMPSSQTNSIGVQGSRQIANARYGICIRPAANQCSITYSLPSSDPYAFTITGDVGAVDPTLLGTDVLQSQTCSSDYVIIPYPNQNNALMPSDRFCGLGFVETTSAITPFVVYVVNDGNELMDIGNRGFAFEYSQNACPVS